MNSVDPSSSRTETCPTRSVWIDACRMIASPFANHSERPSMRCKPEARTETASPARSAAIVGTVTAIKQIAAQLTKRANRSTEKPTIDRIPITPRSDVKAAREVLTSDLRVSLREP